MTQKKNNKLQVSFLQESKKEFLLCLISTYILGLIAHAYGYFNATPSHDWLNAYYADSIENSVKIASGRFLVPVYRAVVRSAVAQPWIIGLVGLLFVSVAVFFTVRTLGITSRKAQVLTAGVMVTNITLTAQTATYLHEFDVNMLALALSAIAAYIWHKRCDLAGLLSGGVLIVISVSIYQSYLSVCIALMIIASILALLDGEKTKSVIKKGLSGIGMIVFGLLLYLAVSRAVYFFADVSQQERTDVFDFSGISNIPLFYAKLFVGTYLHFAKSLVDIKVYNTVLIIGLVLVMLAVCGFCIVYTFIKNKKMTVGSKVTVILLLILLPFGMDITYFLVRGVGVHDLMIYAVWLTYVLLISFTCRENSVKQLPKKGRRAIRTVSFCIVLVFVWQNILLANSAYVKKNIDADSTLSMMTRVVADMEEFDSYEVGKTPVAFVGITEIQSTLGEFGGANEITGIGNMTSPIGLDVHKETFNLYKSYFDYVLNYPVEMCSDELHVELKESEEVKEMPSYPEKGYIREIDGVLVVKMGDKWYSRDN